MPGRTLAGTPTAARSLASAVNAALICSAGASLSAKAAKASADGWVMTFTEVLRSDVANFRYTRLFEQRRIRVLEDSADDVRALAFEMLERAEGRAQYAREDEQLQQRHAILLGSILEHLKAANPVVHQEIMWAQGSSVGRRTALTASTSGPPRSQPRPGA